MTFFAFRSAIQRQNMSNCRMFNRGVFLDGWWMGLDGWVEHQAIISVSADGSSHLYLIPGPSDWCGPYQALTGFWAPVTRKDLYRICMNTVCDRRSPRSFHPSFRSKHDLRCFTSELWAGPSLEVPRPSCLAYQPHRSTGLEHGGAKEPTNPSDYPNPSSGSLVNLLYFM